MNAMVWEPKRRMGEVMLGWAAAAAGMGGSGECVTRCMRGSMVLSRFSIVRSVGGPLRGALAQEVSEMFGCNPHRTVHAACIVH